MSKKNLFYFLAVLALVSGPAWGQTVVHNNDDRDLFIGVGSSTKVRPNIMILAGNSESMNSAIYHLDYDPRRKYTTDKDGNLTLSGIDSVGFVPLGTPLICYTLSKPEKYVTFNICRPSSKGQWVGDASATFNSLVKKNDNTRWKVYKSTVVGSFPFIGQVIDYNCDASGSCSQTRILSIKEDTDKPSGTPFYNIQVDTAYPEYNGDPVAGSTIYINYHYDADYESKQAFFQISGTTCPEGFTQFTNVKLYGTTDENFTSGGQTRYDINYLYWLAFYASQEQLDAVTAWATTGKGPDKNGNLVDYGYYRIEVLRRVLGDVMREVYKDVNLGIARFGDIDNQGYVEGFFKLNNLTNFDSLSSLDSKIKTTIDKLGANTQAPLAESLADTWHYMIGQSPNVLWPHTDANVAQDCPLENYCQKNYVILMTDGQSTYDEFTESPASRFNSSYFAKNPVKKSAGGWGDDDDNDPVFNGEYNWGTQPTDLTKPDGSAYCPDYSCWGVNDHQGKLGTDFLDDVAYYMAHTDHFPDAVFDPCYGITDPVSLKTCQESNAYKVFGEKYQGPQTIETYVIGFNTDNDMLAETAENGNGEYYKATSYDSLKNALTAAIVSINLRNMAFAAFTAPKKITTTVGDGYSFVGYFMPDAVSAIWTGHLQSFLMTDRWYADLDNSKKLETKNATGVNEFVNPYFYEKDCTAANSGSGLICLRSLELASQAGWDTQTKITNDRSLFTNDAAPPYAPIDFTVANAAILRPLFGLDPDVDPDTTNLTNAKTIVSTIGGKSLGDFFHSDIAYVGAPLPGKVYVRNLNPSECTGDTETPREDNPDCFENLLKARAARAKVVYAGSNDGILHQVDAASGEERWGFIPDEVLLSLKKIVIDNQYTYTVDGRLTADDIYYRAGEDAEWRTILVFGLKDGGHSFYALNITNPELDPQVMWKFPVNDDIFCGKSWSKPFIGKVRLLESGKLIDRWVVIVAGGMAFNNENKSNLAGKAVFVIDASTGALLWMIGYSSESDGGAADATNTTYIDTAGSGARYLTAKPEFNYPIPSAVTPVDRDADGYLDTIYFGNVAGHLFKADIASANSAQWKTYQLFKAEFTHKATNSIKSITSNVITLNNNNSGFDLHKNVFGLTSKAMGTIDAVDKTVLTVNTIPPSSFIAGETIVVPSFDPIFLSPAVFYDKCSNLWVAFGTGDRIRSRTNPDTGKFMALRDGTHAPSGSTVQKTDILLSDLVPITWTGTVVNPTNIKVTGKWGWQFTFPMSDNYEKLFDPEPFVLPDENLVPHIYFNSYQPSLEITNEDCAAPKNGIMFVYELACDYCGDGTMAGTMESGRIAGGGIFGTEYITFVGDGDVASIPPLQDIKPIKLFFTGSLLFWKEKKR